MTSTIIKTSISGQTAPVDTVIKHCKNCGDSECMKEGRAYICLECFMVVEIEGGGLEW